MKKIVLLLLVFAMNAGSVMQANEERPTINEPQSLEVEIAKMLKMHHLALDYEMVVDVSLKINKYNEIVVLEINCDNKEVRDYIERCLNNKVVQYKSRPGIKSFNLPVRLKIQE